MDIRYWWVIAIWLAIIGAVCARALMRSRADRSTRSWQTTVANTTRITALSEYEAARRRQLRTNKIVLALASFALLMSVILAARPATVHSADNPNNKRDIMLCLDVSGSMQHTDGQLMDTFIELTKRFQRENIGLTVFNVSPVAVVPLTSDYEYALGRMEIAKKLLSQSDEDGNMDKSVFDDPDYDTLFAGVFWGQENGEASFVGDGLMSCASHMHPGDDRTKIVILATDNEVLGTPLATTKQAMAYAKSQEVRVYAISPPVRSDSLNEKADKKLRDDMAKGARRTGGEGYITSADNVDEIVTDIQSHVAKSYREPNAPAVNDKPVAFALLLYLALLCSVIVIGRSNR